MTMTNWRELQLIIHLEKFLGEINKNETANTQKKWSKAKSGRCLSCQNCPPSSQDMVSRLVESMASFSCSQCLPAPHFSLSWDTNALQNAYPVFNSNGHNHIYNTFCRIDTRLGLSGWTWMFLATWPLCPSFWVLSLKMIRLGQQEKTSWRNCRRVSQGCPDTLQALWSGIQRGNKNQAFLALSLQRKESLSVSHPISGPVAGGRVFSRSVWNTVISGGRYLPCSYPLKGKACCCHSLKYGFSVLAMQEPYRGKQVSISSLHTAQ